MVNIHIFGCMQKWMGGVTLSIDASSRSTPAIPPTRQKNQRLDCAAD
jgi:hypothetical protein